MSFSDLYRDVWNTRAEVQQLWPTPPQLDAFLFAATEGGEALLDHMALALTFAGALDVRPLALSSAQTAATQAIDALLRERDYVRNRTKIISVEDEIADCAMMLATALGPEWNEMWRSLIRQPRDSFMAASVPALALLCSIGAFQAYSQQQAGEYTLLWRSPIDAYGGAMWITSPQQCAVEGLRMCQTLLGREQMVKKVRERLARIKSKVQGRQA